MFFQNLSLIRQSTLAEAKGDVLQRSHMMRCEAVCRKVSKSDIADKTQYYCFDDWLKY